MAKLTDMPPEIMEKIIFELVVSLNDCPSTYFRDSTLTDLAKVNSTLLTTISGIRLVQYDPKDLGYRLAFLPEECIGISVWYFDVAEGRREMLRDESVCHAAHAKYTTHSAKGSRFWADKEKLIECEVIFDRLDWAKFVEADQLVKYEAYGQANLNECEDSKELVLNKAVEKQEGKERHICRICQTAEALYQFPEKKERQEVLKRRQIEKEKEMVERYKIMQALATAGCFDSEEEEDEEEDGSEYEMDDDERYDSDEY